MSLISLAYYKLGDKEVYFIKLLQEAIRVYGAMMAYGNRMIQERMIFLYKEGLKLFEQTQYFFLGLKRILEQGAKKVIKAKRPEEDMMSLLKLTILMLQNSCEGHFKEMKAFLRYQNLSAANVNLVAEVGQLVDAVIDKILKDIAYFDDEDYPGLMEAVGLNYVTNPDRPKKLLDYLDMESMPDPDLLELLV